MDRIRNSVKVGEKRIKEPSSYATSTGPRNTATIRSNDLSQANSLHHSFSNMSIQNTSSKGHSLWTSQQKDNKSTLGSLNAHGGPNQSAVSTTMRDRADSNISRESETSALDRFLTRHYESGAIKLTAQVHEKRGSLEFVITLSVRDFGSKDWAVMRTVDDVIRFCEAIRLAGAGFNFPMPPPSDQMMDRILKQPPMAPPPQPNMNPAAAAALLQQQQIMESQESTSTLESGRRSLKHQKKRSRESGPSGGLGFLKAVSSRLTFSGVNRPSGGPSSSQNTMARRNTTAGTGGGGGGGLGNGNSSSGNMMMTNNERVFPSVQEWFDAALEIWQRKWHSKSDEDGISLAFERFLCDPTGLTSAPIDLLTAADFVVLVTASIPPSATNVQPAPANRRREAVIAKAAIRLAKDYPDAITIDMLKGRVLAYAWEKFESNHPMNVKELLSGQKFLVLSHEELQFMQLQVAQTPVTSPHQEKKYIYIWQPHPQLATLRMNLVENFSVPPTPKSLEHFYDSWRSFSDIVLLRVESRLRAMGMGVPTFYSTGAPMSMQNSSSSAMQYE